ncbi:hypothetical protein ColTof3_11784 [Colletotrichum tofieldiae]|nr:hypothetical protein ColTof3_11784 [Colletotrichum tofieldiae]
MPPQTSKTASEPVLPPQCSTSTFRAWMLLSQAPTLQNGQQSLMTPSQLGQANRHQASTPQYTSSEKTHQFPLWWPRRQSNFMPDPMCFNPPRWDGLSTRIIADHTTDLLGARPSAHLSPSPSLCDKRLLGDDQERSSNSSGAGQLRNLQDWKPGPPNVQDIIGNEMRCINQMDLAPRSL